MDTTEDALLGGRVHVRQPARGYRVNADTILLAAALEAGPGSVLLEAGCGVGGALLCAAARLPGVSFVGLERDPDWAALAAHNAAASPWADRIRIETADVLTASGPPMDGVFCNPPYLRPGEGRDPAPARRAAHIADAPIADWIGALSNLLKGGAALTLIHRADRLADILAALEGRLGGIEIVPIHPKKGEPAARVVVRARKGSRAPLALHGGLALHEPDGRFTPEAAAIFADAAPLHWA
ncbi:MAG: methyltransferase [Alphaproteobacteria bacterium]|nr:methyltransferase [Alphaproteobacteria bacterium]